MTFPPKDWKDLPDTSTPITAAALEDLEARLAAYTDTEVSGVSLSADAPPGTVYLEASGDTTGATDDANFTAALAALPYGGVIYMVGDYSKYFYTQNGWSPPCQTTGLGTAGGGGPVCIQGLGTPKLCPVGNNITGIYYHRPWHMSDPWVSGPAGFIRDVIIDGTNATGASIGLDIGDGMGFDIRVDVRNFKTTNAIGAYLCGRNGSWTEKSHFRIFSYNNTQAVIVGTTQGGVNSHEYNMFDFIVVTDGPQHGVRFDSVFVDGSDILIRGNIDHTNLSTGLPGSIGLMEVVNGGNVRKCMLFIRAEGRNGSGTGTTYPWTVYCDGSSNTSIQQCTGLISTGGNGIQMNGAEFSYSGILGSNEFSSAMADMYPSTSRPASGDTWINNGPDAFVVLDGGTVQDIHINGVSTNKAGGVFPILANAKIRVDYTVAPTWKVIPMAGWQ